ncbi:hypothetical protein HUG17_10386 [Dermatophagoides farinae]|uniref:Uncharacterized protein n=1 Tax=Dermatophagoides farinae TaxID=6954 RepID=A0A9D4NM15_DERFA|nr:hypothetical protein HUG17_10386 [Dermatophagoides farinae]
MAIPNLDSCNDMDKHNNDNNNQFQLILDMGREYGFSIFGHKIDEEYSCHYSCWNGFYQNFRPIPSTSINHKICKLISKELCEHLRNVKIKLQSIRLIFLLNKTFYYFLVNNKTLHSFTIDRLPKTLSFNDDKIIDQKYNVIEWINEHLNDYHIKNLSDTKRKFLMEINKHEINNDPINQIYLSSYNKLDYDDDNDEIMLKNGQLLKMINFDLYLFQQQSYTPIKFCEYCSSSSSSLQFFPPLTTLPLKTFSDCPLHLCIWPMVDSIVYSYSTHQYLIFQGRYLFAYNVDNNQLQMSVNPLSFDVRIIQSFFKRKNVELFQIIYMIDNKLHRMEYNFKRKHATHQSVMDLRLDIDDKHYRLVTGLIDRNEEIYVFIFEKFNNDNDASGSTLLWNIYRRQNLIESKSIQTTMLPLTAMFINKYIHLLIGNQIFIMNTASLIELTMMMEQDRLNEMDCIRMDFFHYFDCHIHKKNDEQLIKSAKQQRIQMHKWFQYFIHNEISTIIDKNFIQNCRLFIDNGGNKKSIKDQLSTSKKVLENLNFHNNVVATEPSTTTSSSIITPPPPPLQPSTTTTPPPSLSSISSISTGMKMNDNSQSQEPKSTSTTTSTSTLSQWSKYRQQSIKRNGTI